MDLKLFGVIPYKNVDVEVIQDKMLIPSGIPIGIYVKTKVRYTVTISAATAAVSTKYKKLLYILSCCLVISTDLFNFHISHY